MSLKKEVAVQLQRDPWMESYAANPLAAPLQTGQVKFCIVFIAISPVRGTFGLLSLTTLFPKL